MQIIVPVSTGIPGINFLYLHIFVCFAWERIKNFNKSLLSTLYIEKLMIKQTYVFTPCRLIFILIVHSRFQLCIEIVSEYWWMSFYELLPRSILIHFISGRCVTLLDKTLFIRFINYYNQLIKSEKITPYFVHVMTIIPARSMIIQDFSEKSINLQHDKTRRLAFIRDIAMQYIRSRYRFKTKPITEGASIFFQRK